MHAEIGRAHFLQAQQPEQGMRAGFTQFAGAARAPLGQRLGRVGKRQEAGMDILPDIVWGAVAAAFGLIGLDLLRQGSGKTAHICRVPAEIQRGGGDRDQVDALNLAGLFGPPRVVGIPSTEDLGGDRTTTVFRWEQALLGVEPVGGNGLRFSGVEPDTKVAQGQVAGGLAPQDQPGPGIDGFRGRFLVVAIGRVGIPRGPRMALIGVEVAHKREIAAAALRRGDVGRQQVDHATPVVRCGPGRVAQGQLGCGMDPVAIVEVMVVHVRDTAVLVRIADHGAQSLVLDEVAAGIVATKPGLETLTQGGQFLVA